MRYDALLLASFGGPEGPDEVMPFLERVTAGRGVPRERLEEVAHHYYELGGVSPINAQNRSLLAALREELDRRGIDLPLYWGNRNSAPFFADVLADIQRDGRRRILALATSAYSSYSGCRQYRENLAQARSEAGLDGELFVAKAPQYFRRPGFIEPFRRDVAAALEDLAGRGFANAETVVLFTTHSIPTAMALGAGPDGDRALPGLYERQHLHVAERVMAAHDVPWQLVFQSRSGPPQVPWLEPDVNDALREASERRARAAVVVPIGFISDHVEVVWDLDHEARETADELGMTMVRVPTPGTDPLFVSALVDVLVDALEGVDVRAAAGTEAELLCSPTCCANARADLATVPSTVTAE